MLHMVSGTRMKLHAIDWQPFFGVAGCHHTSKWGHIPRSLATPSAHLSAMHIQCDRNVVSAAW